jgi:hypothetical protein
MTDRDQRTAGRGGARPWRCQPKPGRQLNHQRTSLLKRASATMLASVIDPDSAVPPYEQLAHMLRDEIGQGLLSGRVPSIHAISQHHHVSHRVAAVALSILKGRGTDAVACHEAKIRRSADVDETTPL